MSTENDRNEAAERIQRALEAASADKNDEEDDDLLGRFPDPEADERLRVPRGDALPEVPEAKFTRPTLPQPDPAKDAPGFSSLKGDMRGMGEASTIGMTLVFSIAIGAGFGYLFDTFVLKNPATPWGLIVGFLLGTASGFINLVRVANRINDRHDRDRKK